MLSDLDLIGTIDDDAEIEEEEESGSDDEVSAGCCCCFNYHQHQVSLVSVFYIGVTSLSKFLNYSLCFNNSRMFTI